jgi:hypothetical protein
MKNVLLKKGTKIIIVSMIIVSSTTTSYVQAAENDIGCKTLGTPSVSVESCSGDIEYEPLVELVDNIEFMGFEVNAITQSEQENPVIEISSERVESQLEISCVTNNSIAITISEGNIKNELIFNDDGSMYVDGRLISDEDASINDAEDVVYMNAFDDYFQIGCPYGTSANYANFYKTEKNPSVKFTNLAKNLGTFALAAIISRFIPGFDLTLGFSMIVAEYIKTYDPLSGAASFVTRQYFHVKGYFVTNSLAARKYITTVYTKENYTGKATNSVYYFIHKFNM